MEIKRYSLVVHMTREKGIHQSFKQSFNNGGKSREENKVKEHQPINSFSKETLSEGLSGK